MLCPVLPILELLVLCSTDWGVAALRMPWAKARQTRGEISALQGWEPEVQMDFEEMLEEQSAGMDIMSCFSQGNRGGELGSSSCGMQSVLMLGFSGPNRPNSESLALLHGQMVKVTSPSISHTCFFFHVSHHSHKELSASSLRDNRRSLPSLGYLGSVGSYCSSGWGVLTIQWMHFWPPESELGDAAAGQKLQWAERENSISNGA